MSYETAQTTRGALLGELADIDKMLSEALGEAQPANEDNPVRYEIDLEREFVMARMAKERRIMLGRLGGILTGRYTMTRLTSVGPNDQIEMPDLSVTTAKLSAGSVFAQDFGFIPASSVYEKSVFGPTGDNYMFPVGLSKLKDREILFLYKASRSFYKNGQARCLDPIYETSPFLEKGAPEPPDRTPTYYANWHSIIAVDTAVAPETLSSAQDEVFVENIKNAIPGLLGRYREYLADTSLAA